MDMNHTINTYATDKWNLILMGLKNKKPRKKCCHLLRGCRTHFFTTRKQVELVLTPIPVQINEFFEVEDARPQLVNPGLKEVLEMKVFRITSEVFKLVCKEVWSLRPLHT